MTNRLRLPTWLRSPTHVWLDDITLAVADQQLFSAKSVEAARSNNHCSSRGRLGPLTKRSAGARCEAAWRPYSSPFFARAYAHTSQGFAQTPPAITAQSLMPPDIPTKPQTNRICMRQAPTLASLPQLGKSWDFRLNVKLQIADTSIDQPQPQTIVSAPGLPA